MPHTVSNSDNPLSLLPHPHLQKLYAIDLVGFGASDKPLLQYTIELWADLIQDFLAEFAGGSPAVVVGNSIGSLSVLTAAASAPQGMLAGLVLLNSAGAMNNKVCAMFVGSAVVFTAVVFEVRKNTRHMDSVIEAYTLLWCSRLCTMYTGLHMCMHSHM
jgi:pimeloyl-ACP methyl ester carboxylesterase